MWRTILWMYQTQRNDKGPRKVLGVTPLEWFLLLAMLLGAGFGLWLLFRGFVSLHYALLPQRLSLR